MSTVTNTESGDGGGESQDQVIGGGHKEEEQTASSGFTRDVSSKKLLWLCSVTGAEFGLLLRVLSAATAIIAPSVS